MNNKDFARSGETERKESVVSELFAQTVYEELSEDFILPDVLPDVKRLLTVTPSVLLGESCVTDKGILFGGEVSCSILYCSDTDKLKSVTYQVPFRHEEGVAGVAERSCTLSVIPYISEDATRLLNPRKIGIRIKLCAGIRVFGSDSVSVGVSGTHSADDALAMERDTCTAKRLRILTGEKQNVNVSEDIELDSTNPTIGEIIGCSLRIVPAETRVIQENAEIVAEAVFRCLYESENGNYFVVVKRFRLEESVEFPEAENGSECLTRIYCGPVRVSAQNNSYGERRIIELDASFHVSVAAMSNEETVLTRDAYSTEYVSVNTYENRRIASFERSFSTNFSLNASKAREECAAEQANAILDGDTEAVLTGIRYDRERKKLILEGTARITAVTVSPPSGETEELQYGLSGFQEPFRCEMDVPGYGDDSDAIAVCDVMTARYRLDSTRVYADAEIGIRLYLINNKPQTIVTGIELDAEKPYETQKLPPVTLYYPRQGETLWEIAKRYHTTRYAICRANGIEEETAQPDAHVLLIPRGKKKAPSYSKII